MEDFNFFIWLSEKLGFHGLVTHANVHIFGAGFIAIILVLISLVIGFKLRNPDKYLVPSKKISLIGLFDMLIGGILNLMEGVLGKHAIDYLPLIGSLFLYIIFCNLIGMIPGFVAPTDNINTNLPCALTVFVYYHVVGIKKNGLKKYLKHFAGPIIWLAPLIFTLEIVSNCVRPVSLSVRLFGNITGDHLVLTMFSDLVPVFVPVIFLGLALFVAFIQAFVFSLLSTVYIALAVGHED